MLNEVDKEVWCS